MPREQMQYPAVLPKHQKLPTFELATQNDAIGIQGNEIMIKSLEERIKYIALTYGWLKS